MPAKRFPTLDFSAKALDCRLTKVAGVSWEQVRTAICDALRDKFPPTDDCCGPYPWVEDVFDDHAVFCMDGKLFSIGYTFANGTAALSGDPAQVMRTYAPVGGGAAPPAPAIPAPAAPGEKQARANLAQKAQASLDALKKRLTPSKGA